MRYLFCFIVLFLFLVPAKAEQSVTLAWDANSEPDIGGYIVYYGIASRNYTNAVNVGNVTTNTVNGLVDGVTYYFAVTAYNTNGLESEFSDEVSYARPPGAVSIFALRPSFSRTNVVLRGQASTTNLGFWFELSLGSGTTNWIPIQALPPTNGIYWAEVSLAPTNWTYRFVGTNVANQYVSTSVVFSTVPPAKPNKLRFKIQLIQSASLSGPWKEFMQASILVPYPPEGNENFYRSLFSWAPEYEP